MLCCRLQGRVLPVFGVMTAQKNRLRCPNLHQRRDAPICPAMGGGGKAMHHLRQGHQLGLIAPQMQPPVQVGFIQVIVIGLVKTAKPAQNIAAHRHICAFGFQRMARRQRRAPGLLAMQGRGVGGAGAVYAAAGPLKGNTVAPAHIAAGAGQITLCKGRHQMRQPPWLGLGIVVDKGHHLARGHSQPQIARGRDIGLVAGHQFYHRRVRQAGHGGTACGICHNDNFVSGGQPLPRQGLHAQNQRVGPLPADDNNAGGGQAHSMPISAIMACRRGTSSGLFNSQNWRPRACTCTHKTA